MSTAVAQGQQTLEISRVASRSDLRAYVIFERIDWKKEDLAKDPGLTINFKNIGKTPALKVQTYGCLIIVQKKDSTVGPDQSGWNRFLDRIFVAAKLHPTLYGTDVAPQSGSGHKITFTGSDCGERPFLTPEQIKTQLDSYTAGESDVVLIAGAVYRDSFGSKHETQFCQFVVSNKDWLCATHNTIR
jgi:hypothetical protein